MAQRFNPELHCDDGEGVRDHNHCVAPLMILDKFVAVHIAHGGKNILWKMMLNSLYIHQLQVIDWPASIPPIGFDFIFKDLNTGELKALIVPYLKCCMGQDYGAKLIPNNELKFKPWSDDAKAIFKHEDNEMLNIPLVTDTEGKVLRTLMDCAAFMKNLPAGVVPPRAATPLIDSPAVSDLPPSSPMQWDPSPPHREVVQPLPSCSHLVPVPTKICRHQPTESIVQHTSHPTAMPRTSCPEPARSLTTQHDSHYHGPCKVPAMPPTCKHRRDDESEGKDARDNKWAKGSMMWYVLLRLFLLYNYLFITITRYESGDHCMQHGLQCHPTHLPRIYESPSPPPIWQRHQYSYSCTSNAVAGSSRLNTDGWKSKSPEVYYDDVPGREFYEPRD
ncbi:hypothetical protein AZE42_11220 [Rhizopogon vesiculosus]|uniref:Uncharacterized protein n=1 Tax=Rhizopogon vesiculosus TaxID=180088 RepID=A0A1J8PUP3_9AGAM|nr:hypothetical protein AZE42_11220 [Rhizopogon vesiculosus]